ncbi:hypothetical protein GBK02_14885 [Dechloromonas sp. TW-R-39-2]|uniref:hypothetical protein n=1 Tax=Dechloromonas sp. TW-R-39-2 TaxID=2654218 RepID=UPI00193D7ABE|nr:hypothetical protein [Dechloromonas sp. TW-R-39-2]QRM20576.1 hypothetical protein GBK02_14885 [Dechloromonas sp. TW-R-39-2]
MLAYIGISGCSIHHDYSWEEHRIDAAALNLPALTSKSQNRSIRVTSGKTDNTKITVSHTAQTAHYWDSSLQYISDKLVTQITNELQRRNYTTESVSKWAEVRVVDYDLHNQVNGNYHYLSTIEVRLGNGKIINVDSRIIGHNYRPATAVDYVIAQAAVDILNNNELLSYLNNE